MLGGQINRYYQAQAQNYALGGVTHLGTHYSDGDLRIRYVNQLGAETLYVSVAASVIAVALERVEQQRVKPPEPQATKALAIDVYVAPRRYDPRQSRYLVTTDPLVYRRATWTTVTDAFALEVWTNYGKTNEDTDMFLEQYATDLYGAYTPPDGVGAIWFAGSTEPIVTPYGNDTQLNFLQCSDDLSNTDYWGAEMNTIDSLFIFSPDIAFGIPPYLDEYPEPPYERMRSILIFPNSVESAGTVTYFDTPIRIGMEMLGGYQELLMGTVTSTASRPIDRVKLRVREYNIPDDDENSWCRVGDYFFGYSRRLAENSSSLSGPWTLQLDNYGAIGSLDTINMYVARTNWVGNDSSVTASMENDGMGELVLDMPTYRTVSVPCPAGDPQELATYTWTAPGNMTPIYELVYKPNEENIADRVVVTEL